MSEPDGKTAADVMVIFGITGDLARKMTFHSLYRLESGGQLDCPIIGVARNEWSDDELRAYARQALEASGGPVQDEVFSRLAQRLSYHGGDFADPGTYQALAKRLKGHHRPLYYLEIPPSLFAPVVEALGQAGLTAGATVMIEKPFGHDLPSARELNDRLHKVLAEDQILRIDHFLGKQPVLDLHFLRFANALFEPVWNRLNIAAVHITMAEDFGVEDRGAFYDAVGTTRDVVQNHLLQVLALVAMEPPVAAGPDALSDRKVDVFRAMPDVDPARCVLGQYEGYDGVPGVKRGSTTETYVALRLGIDNWRWTGVPFFIRAGKALPVKLTELRVTFKRAPRLAFLDVPEHPNPNQLVLRIDPEPGLCIGVLSKSKEGTRCRDVHLELAFAAELGQPPEPYERLIHDALSGDRSLFTRERGVEETWRILQPLIEHLDGDAQPASYARGSWGPAGADDVVRGYPPWHEPWLPKDSEGDDHAHK